MEWITWTLDLLLVLALVGLTWASLAAKDLFASIALFITFGLLMALTWARLGSVDIALAEGAIGAGLTGALLMIARQGMQGTVASRHAESLAQAERSWGSAGPPLRSPRGIVAPLLEVLLLLLGLAAGWAIWRLPREARGLIGPVEAKLPESGVENPVTAVLLNFRGYDTLLELAVLLLAAVGVYALRAQVATPVEWLPQSGSATGPVLAGLIRVVAPLVVLISTYLLWRGSHAPGGAFQGGALLGAGGVLLLLGGNVLPCRARGRLARFLLAAGPAVFLVVGGGVMVLGLNFLEYPVPWAKTLILLVETSAMLSIAAIFAALFASFLPGELQPPATSPRQDQEE